MVGDSSTVACLPLDSGTHVLAEAEGTRCALGLDMPPTEAAAAGRLFAEQGRQQQSYEGDDGE